MANNGEAKQIDDGIANSHDQQQVLKGVQPKHQTAYKIFKFSRIYFILMLFIVALLFGMTFVNVSPILTKITGHFIYRIGLILLAASACICLLFGMFIKSIFLKKAPFDDWVYEIAEKRLGTSIIFYDSKHIYINYDRSGKEVDKREFVTEMSDKSVHFTYYYIDTDIDTGFIRVECKKRQPIPDRASFSEKDDKYWNIVPMGLTINPKTQCVSAIGWYLNDQNKNDELYETIPSTSILICGGTGCYSKDTPILMYDTLVH